MEVLQEGRKEFLAWAKADENAERANNLLKDFLAARQKFPAPENNMDWWIKNKSPLALHTYIQNFKSKTAKEKEDRLKGADKIYNDDNWTVLHIKTYEAAKQYGKGSKWCICGNYPGHEERGQYYFNDYLENNYLGYYVFLNKNPNDPMVDGKYMVCIKKDDPTRVDIWNQADSRIDYIPKGPTIKGFPLVSQMSILDGKLIGIKNSYANVEVPEGVESLKYKVFMKYKGSNIKLPSTLKEIGSGAFMQSSVENMEIPDSVTEIGKGILCNCEYLKKVSLGKGITVIPDLTFAYSDLLEIVRIDGDITEISDTAFKGIANKDLTIFYKGYNKVLADFGHDHHINVYDSTSGEIISDRDPR